MSRAPVAIAVVSWNTRELLAQCLESLAPEVKAGRCKVWVVDNASTDGSPEMVEERFEWVRLIASDRNLGFGAAVNLAATQSHSEWIAPANADIRVCPGSLEALMAAGADPRIGAVAPRLITAEGATQHSVHAFPTLGLAISHSLGLTRIPSIGRRLAIEGHWDPERARRIDWAHGAFLLIRREAFEGIGGFDSEQWMYAEDIDLQWRLKRAGWSVSYQPWARVDHEVSAATEAAFGGQRIERFLAATYTWQTRRQGSVAARSSAAVNAAGIIVRIPWVALKTITNGHSRWALVRSVAFLRGHLIGLRSRYRLERIIAPDRDSHR